MTAQTAAARARVMLNPNGPGAATVLSAGLGCFCVALFAVLADKVAAIKTLMIFYKPTGPLSGVTTCAIFAWLASWSVLHWLWSRRNVEIKQIAVAALILLAASLLLTFPPIADLL